MRNHVLIMCSLAACLLSGCSESDYGSDSANSKNPSSGSMSIDVSLPSGTTRVTETADATKGMITTWENTDALQVFHKYTYNATAGAMQGFTFASKGAGSSTTFAYSGAAGYSFTPNSSLYAFNALPTASNYTKTYNSSTDNFTLSLSGYGSQNGTVTNLRNYDAMYGVSSVNAGGTPAAMEMKHLTSVLRFDLSNTAFTGTLSSVTFTYTASSGSSLLPASGGFTLSNTGTVTGGTLTGGTSWTVNNVSASSGTASVYLMTFPDTRSGTLTITATASNGSTYSRTITLSALSLTSGSMKAYKVTLNSSVTTYSLKYYSWDATAEYIDGVTNYNTITTGVATNSCKDCPTFDQMQMYIGAGAYWDSSTSWKDGSGTAHTGGIWLKKKAYISGFDAGTATKVTSAAPTNGVPTNTSEYFFLPAGGYVSGSNSASDVGNIGYYWSSMPSSEAPYVYMLGFDSYGVEAGYLERNYGFCTWSVQ